MGRRANSEGTVFQRQSDGRWVATLTVDGCRVSRYAPTQAAAIGKLDDLRVQNRQGAVATNLRLSVGQHLEQWLTGTKSKVRPGTWVTYSWVVKTHLIPRLGRIKLNKLTPEQVEKAWSSMLSDGASAYTVECAHRRLSRALSEAVRRGLLFRNVCKDVSPPRLPDKELRPPDTQAMLRILEAARNTPYHEVLYVAFHTGARRGELLGLKWRDLDLTMGTASINRSLYRADRQTQEQEPKTKKSRRLVPLTPSSALVLRALREHQQADAAAMGYMVTDDSPVFRYRDGAPILPRSLSGGFRKVMRRAGLEGYRLHDIRHAHATELLKQGTHPKVVQERLGHAKIGTTLDLYSHTVPGLQEAAALRFDEGLAPAPLKRIDSRIDSNAQGRVATAVDA